MGPLTPEIIVRVDEELWGGAARTDGWLAHYDELLDLGDRGQDVLKREQ